MRSETKNRTFHPEYLRCLYARWYCGYGNRGKTYILTTNEGDTREWGSGVNAYADITSFKISDYSMDVLDNTKKDGLEEGKKYLLGARSFSIWDTSDSAIRLIYDSKNEFERRTAEYFPTNFNASHTNNNLDSRSGRKGPEPEYVETLKIKNKIYALIGLERIGGIMVFDFPNLKKPSYFSKTH
jgi:hypothetical protein